MLKFTMINPSKFRVSYDTDALVGWLDLRGKGWAFNATPMRHLNSNHLREIAHFMDQL